MKKTVLLLLALCTLAGCSAVTVLPDDPIVFSYGTDTQEGYTYLALGERVYVPYGACQSDRLGECIGYYEHSGVKSFVYELAGYSSDEWIVNADVNGRRDCMIMHAEASEDISEEPFAETGE